MNPYLDSKNHILNFMQRDLPPSVGDKGLGGIVVAGVKSIDTARRAVEAVLSCVEHDRYGEVILPRSYEPWMTRFADNPVLLSSHDHALQIGHWEKMKITDSTLEGWAVFDDKPSNEEAQKVWGLIEGKHRKGFSVGAIMHEWKMLTAAECAALLPKHVKGPQFEGRSRVFTSAEPIEGSSVAVPAAPSALSKAMQMIAVADTFGTEMGTVETEGVHPLDLKRHEAVKKDIRKTIEQLLTDPRGPMPIAIQNAMDDWYASRGLRDHDHGDPGGDSATRRAELDNVAKELQRTLDRLRR